VSCHIPGFRLLAAAVAAAWQFATPTFGAHVLPQPAVDTVVESAGSVIPEPVRARARPTTRLVYSCVMPGLVTFADRPCGPAAQPRELKLSTPPPAASAAGESSSIDEPTAAAAQARRNAAAKADAAAARAAADRAATCLRLEAALDEVDSQMRAGYPAREAGRLWERWRGARASLREARC
jgi:hypothetical protein